MASTNGAEFKRLILKIERNLFAQVHLRTLLTALDKAYAEDQQELRAIKTRIKRNIATASGRKADRATAASQKPRACPIRDTSQAPGIDVVRPRQ